ncbi:FG-GAP-like repeat-containing protein [Streptomyces sp. AM 3-1-1]|uniref:FG-GAP-like repeat-containing protein n=1 Tax=Streptomyces sp. AM 3-1-1 TaxID=3028711 RepID=UPI0023B8AFA5|nr:FG-GAP-like repeat-containing protein [Streptomyces sp. AM 3-1-1]WEH29047.1 FG-GAP-like repeat-containing protein [Streptomyces sp. AM 3-1-1]
MPTSLSRRALRSVLAAGALAAPFLIPASASAATGPATTSASYAFTARLDIGQGTRACSGALVAPNWIATSASCFAENTSTAEAPEGAPRWKTTATIGRQDLTTTSGQVRDVVEVVPRADRDLVLARLDRAVTGIAPVRLATTPVAPGTALTVAGFGRTKDEWSPLKLHTADFLAGDATTADLPLTGKTADDAVCAGDAGGPVLRTTSGTPELVGVNSRSWQGGCFGSDSTRNDAIATRTDNTAHGATLAPGALLLPGDTLISNAARLTMREDGELALVTHSGATVWSSGTAGHPGATARFTEAGDLSVTGTSGTVLWHAGTAAAGGTLRLQDRGNLVIEDSGKATVWAAGSEVRHDYDGDGRSDVAAWYDYADGHDALRTFTPRNDGTLPAPGTGWQSPAGNFWAEHMKQVTGDFNGDGIGDVAAFYGYDDGKVTAFTWLGKGDGTFAGHFASWTAEPGNWNFDHMTVQAGDFNGDGRDDVAVWYAYDDGSDKLYTLLSDAKGGFTRHFSSFARTDGYTVERMKFVTGDFNGDGRDDLAALYGYATGDVKLLTWTGKPDGGFNEPVHGWESSGWNFAQASLYAGDFDGDGRDEVAAWYDYADGHDAVIGFSATDAAGTLGNREELWTTAAGNYTKSNMQPVTGDFDGDGRDDLATLYGYSDGRVATVTWTAKADGTLNSPAHGWETPAGNWTFGRVHVIDRYTANGS